jgi:hypothetical protein
VSFTGDLEHLPIVDVIQLLHATRKSGTLNVMGHRGECQLAFRDGFIVSANHPRNNILIGQLLVDNKAISPDVLEHALLEQKEAGENRRPLIAMLIERGDLKKEEGFKGLEILIEMTIVEILTWTKGTFSLNVDRIDISDEYQYFPEKLQQEISLNTQSILMDALRIYDERKRDGVLDEEDFAEDLPVKGGAAEQEDSQILSAEMLGLADLDKLEKRIPGVFASLGDQHPSDAHRMQIGGMTSNLTATELEELFVLLEKYESAPARQRQSGQSQAVILFSPDELLRYAVTTVCKPAGILVFATNDAGDLDPIIDQYLAKDLLPVLVFDRPEESVAASALERTAALRREKMEKYPHLTIIQLTSPLDYAFSLQALGEGVKAILPRPWRDVVRPGEFIEDTARFLEAFRGYLQGTVEDTGERMIRRLRSGMASLYGLREPSEIAFQLLQLVAETFVRTMTLVVGKEELIAERSIGIGRAGEPVPSLRIPLARASVFRTVVEEGRIFYGSGDDEVLKESLFATIGAPCSGKILLLPMKSRGRTVSLTYGDFGPHEASPIRLDLLEILAGHAGLVLENAFYRKKVEILPR